MKKKDALDKLFVNCNKIKEGTAKKIIHNRRDLSLKDYKWDIPINLQEISKIDENRFETFIGLGRWKNKQTKFILIAKKGELIYLEPRIVEIMYNSIKDLNEPEVSSGVEKFFDRKYKDILGDEK